MTKSYVVIILFLTGLIGCDIREKAKQPKKIELAERPTTPIHDKKRMYELIDSALMMGDERAYATVSAYYFLEKQEQELFYCAFTMANKYKSPAAHYHVYMIIAYSTPKEAKTALAKMDSKTKNLAMYYLLKSYEMGYDQAKFEVQEFFGKGTAIPKSSLYLQNFCTD
jgi:hypothetical protein